MLGQFLCHNRNVNHGRSTFHLHQGRAAFSDPFFVSGAEIHRRLSAQYGNSVLQQRSVYERVEKFKNVRTSVTHEGSGTCVARCSAKNIIF